MKEHLEEKILPGLALYQVLLEELPDREAALAEVDDLFLGQLQTSKMKRQVDLLSWLPNPFPLLRLANRWILLRKFPPQGWQIDWVEDSSSCVAFNIKDCFYWRMLNTYGAPELTAHFCALDDHLYGNLRGLTWGRTQTIGRGDLSCNFQFWPKGRTAEKECT